MARAVVAHFDDGNGKVGSHDYDPSLDVIELGEHKDEAASMPGPLIGGGDRDKSFSGHVKARVLEWSIEDCTVRVSRKQSRTLLRNIAGRAEAGTFTAVLGPSGCGKTTLLNCLSLRNKQFRGALRLDGQPLTSEFFKDCAYVNQREMFFSNLTVHEHLYFHAVNRVGGIHSRKECVQRVEQVIKEVALAKCAHSEIGGGEFSTSKGLSGGERKRLNIATELLADPSILYLDEPTSGLDAVMGELICVLLKSLASNDKSKRLILTVIHTPSSRMFTLFTHVLLLSSKGQMVYHGPRANLLPYLEKMGYRCPTHFNTADFVLELASDKVIKGLAIANGDSVQSNEAVTADGDNLMVASDAHERLTAAWTEATKNMSRLAAEEAINVSPAGAADTGSSFFTKLQMNTWRAWTQHQRELLPLVVGIVMNLVLGFVFGLVYWAKIGGDSFGLNTLGFLFLTCTTIVISASVQVALTFPMDYQILVREYFSRANTPTPYFIGRTVAGIPFSMVFMLMAIVPYFMVGLANNGTAFWTFCLIIALMITGAQSLGYLASSFSHIPLVALGMVPMFTTTMILFSGFLYQRNTIWKSLAWLQDLSVVNFSFGALVINQVKYVKAPLRKGVLDLIQLETDQMWPFIRNLIYLVVGIRVAACLILNVRMRFAKPL